MWLSYLYIWSSARSCQICKAWIIVFLFFYFLFDLFFLFELRVRVSVTLWPCCHKSVTLDDTVTVTVTSHEVIEKDIEDSGRIVKFINGKLSFLIFIFISIYFLTFLFLEHRVRVIDGHKSQDAWNKIEGFRTNDVIQYEYHMLTSCSTHGHLG